LDASTRNAPDIAATITTPATTAANTVLFIDAPSPSGDAHLLRSRPL
jgi:hypothetical protein